ncbi:MAG: PAS domain S-box protein [Candidatus Thorarchaeota archaeon]
MSRGNKNHGKDDLSLQSIIEETYSRAQMYLDVAGVILMVLDTMGRIILLNRKGHEILGYDNGEAIGESWFAQVPESERAAVEENFHKLISGELSKIDYIERSIINRSGERRTIAWRTNILKDDQGRAIGLISSGEDITERKIAEERLAAKASELSDRVKELTCLYESSRLLSSDKSLDEILEHLVFIMQPAWRYPECACVRAIYHDTEYVTGNFRETQWKQAVDIEVANKEVGSLEVFYLEEKPLADEGPFLKEERFLLKSLAENLSRFLERYISEEALQWELRVNKAVADLSNALISSDKPIIQVAQLVLEYSKQLTKSEHGYVSSIDPVTRDNIGHTLTEMMKGQCNVDIKDIQAAFMVNEDLTYGGLWGHSLNTLESFYTNFPQEHQSHSGTPEEHIPLKNFLSVPAVIAGELVGQIALSNAKNDYTDRDLEAIERLGKLYAIAINRKRAEDALIESEERHRTLVQSMHELVFVYDSENRYSQYYGSPKHLLYKKPEEFMGAKIDDVLPADVVRRYKEAASQIRETGTSQTIDYQLLINGTNYWFSSTLSLHEDKKSIVWVVHDITEKKLVELEREQHERELALYTSLLHHDLGNDLQIILGYIDAANILGHDNSRTLEMISTVENAAQRMKNLLEALSRPEEDVEQEIPQLISRVATEAQKIYSGLSVKIAVAKDAQPLRIIGGRLLPMVFENIIRNSVQFSAADPEIEISISKSEKRAFIDISDNGPGVAPEIKKKLFSKGVSTTGGGFGLYLVKHVLSAYNGTIELLDEEGRKGATFRISLPLT